MSADKQTAVFDGEYAPRSFARFAAGRVCLLPPAGPAESPLGATASVVYMADSRIGLMRAEAQSLVQDIKQSMELLRRHL